MKLLPTEPSIGSGSVFVKIWGILSWCLLIVLALLGFVLSPVYAIDLLFEFPGLGYYPDDPLSIQECMGKYIFKIEDLKAILRTFTLAFAAYIVISTVFVYPRAVRSGNASSPFKWYATIGMAVLFLVCIPAALWLMYGITFQYGGTPHNLWSNVLAAIVVAFILFSIYTIYRMKKHEAVIFKRGGMSCFLLAAMALSIILFEYVYTCGNFDRIPVRESEVDHAIGQYKQCATLYVVITPILNLFFVAYIVWTLSWMYYWHQSANLADAARDETLREHDPVI